MNVRKLFSAALAAAVTVACSDSGTLAPRSNASGNVGLTFGVMSGASASSAQLAATRAVAPVFSNSAVINDTLVISAGSDTMRITEILLTIEEIELERDGQTAICSDSSSRSDTTSSSTVAATLRRGSDDSNDDSSDDSSSSSDDDCEDHIGGPVLVNLHLDGSGSSQINVNAILGAYDTLEFDFDVADEDDVASAAFRAAHPEMANASARITGTFNGTPFVLKLDSELKYEVALTVPLVVTENSTGFELAVKVDVGAWLTRFDGSLINPLTICPLGSDCTDREIIEENMDDARVRADGRRRD